MEFGKHHNQAMCACATDLLNRVYAILRDNRPYQLRDLDGSPLTKKEARHICQTKYYVPPDVRRRTNYRVRRARAEQRLEKRHRH